MSHGTVIARPCCRAAAPRAWNGVERTRTIIDSSDRSLLGMDESVGGDRSLVLVVEDDHDIQRLIARRLRESGAEVVTAETAGDGFLLYGERQPDLVMVDLNLPDGSGLGL